MHTLTLVEIKMQNPHHRVLNVLRDFQRDADPSARRFVSPRINGHVSVSVDDQQLNESPTVLLVQVDRGLDAAGLVQLEPFEGFGARVAFQVIGEVEFGVLAEGLDGGRLLVPLHRVHRQELLFTLA